MCIVNKGPLIASKLVFFPSHLLHMDMRIVMREHIQQMVQCVGL